MGSTGYACICIVAYSCSSVTIFGSKTRGCVHVRCTPRRRGFPPPAFFAVKPEFRLYQSESHHWDRSLATLPPGTNAQGSFLGQTVSAVLEERVAAEVCRSAFCTARGGDQKIGTKMVLLKYSSAVSAGMFVRYCWRPTRLGISSSTPKLSDTFCNNIMLYVIRTDNIVNRIRPITLKLECYLYSSYSWGVGQDLLSPLPKSLGVGKCPLRPPP